MLQSRASQPTLALEDSMDLRFRPVYSPLFERYAQERDPGLLAFAEGVRQTIAQAQEALGREQRPKLREAGLPRESAESSAVSGSSWPALTMNAAVLIYIWALGPYQAFRLQRREYNNLALSRQEV